MKLKTHKPDKFWYNSTFFYKKRPCMSQVISATDTDFNYTRISFQTVIIISK